MIPAGSRRSFRALKRLHAHRSPTSAGMYGAWSRPTAWWCVIVPPVATIASHAAVLTARHCSISAPGRARGDEGEVERGAVAVGVREMAPDQPGRSLGCERATQRVADRAVEVLIARPGVRGLEGLDEVAEVEQLVAQVRPVEPAVAPGPARRAARASRRPPTGASATRAPAAARRPPASPSQPAIIMQPPVRRRSRRYESSSDRLSPEVPDSASETRVSSASESRVTSGSRPA